MGIGVTVGLGRRAESGHIFQGGQRSVAAVRGVTVHQRRGRRRSIIVTTGIVAVVDGFVAVHPVIAAAVSDEYHVLPGMGRQSCGSQVRDAGFEARLHVGTQEVSRPQDSCPAVDVKIAGILQLGHGHYGRRLAAEHSDAHIDVIQLTGKLVLNIRHHLLDRVRIARDTVQAAGAVQHELHRHGTLVRGGGDRQIQCRFAAFQFRSILVQNNTLLGIGDLSRIRALIFGCSRRKRGRHHAKQHDGSQNPR